MEVRVVLWAWTLSLFIVAGDEEALRLLRSTSGEVPERMGGLALVGAYRQPSAIRLLFTLDDSDPSGRNLVEFVLTTRDESQDAWERTANYNIAFRGPTAGRRPAPQVAPLAEAVLEAVRRNEDPTGPPLAPPPTVDRQGSPEAAGWRILDRVTALAGIVLVLAFILLAPTTGRRLWADLSERLGPAAWAVLALAVAGMAVRLALPHRPVMYYMGYHLAESAASLADIPKYGPGALAMYHLFFLFTGTSHVAMALLNSVLGGLLPVPAAALLARAGAGRAGAVAAAALLAGVPLFVKDSTTESLGVPTVLWTLTGLALLLRWRSGRSVFDLGLAVLHLLLAMESRPEAVLLVPLTAALVAWQGEAGPRLAPATRPAAALAVAAGLLVLARVAHLLLAVSAERARGASPILGDPVGMLGLVDGLWTRNLMLWPQFFPAGVTALAALALLAGWRARMVRAAALLVAAALWLLASFLDLPYVSLPRVQAPALALVALAAAWGVDAAASLAARLPAWARAALPLPLASAVVATAVPTVPTLWARTNADDEEDLLLDALAALPPEPAVLVRRGYDDQPVEPPHLYSPDYLFEAAGHRVTGPDRFGVGGVVGERPAYFLLGTRCYLRACGEGGVHPACARMAERFMLDPVLERMVPVRTLPVDRPRRDDQDLDFPWCVHAPDGTMRLGLYRVRDRS